MWGEDRAAMGDDGEARSGARDAPRRVLVLQGGGALGAYQAGVYEALAREGQEPEWVAGISIGAVNAALIAGNLPKHRVERLRAFWTEVSSALVPAPVSPLGGLREAINLSSAALVAAFGAPGFFAPRWPGPFFAAPGTPEALSFYDSAPLRRSLERLVDFDVLNNGSTRLSVGAVNILTGATTVFDTATRRIGPEHIMASGALPPGLPYVEIDGQPYWDGGLVSNTPLQFVLDEDTVDPLLIYQVDLFNAHGPMPKTLLDADEREREIRYSSRTRMNTDAALRLHRAKMALQDLLKALPDDLAKDEDLDLLRELSRENAVTVVQLIYRKAAYENGSKDYEFSRQTMLDHWASGVADASSAVARCGEQLDTPAAAVVTLDPGHPDAALKPEPPP